LPSIVGLVQRENFILKITMYDSVDRGP